MTAPTPWRRDMLTAQLRRRESGIVVALGVLVLVTTVINPGFATGADGFRNLLLTPSLLMILAVAQAIVIITRNVDLSVSAVLGLTAYATGRMLTELPQLPVLVTVGLGIGLGVLLGALNGVLVSLAGVPSLVITLGTLYAYRGVTVAWAGGDRINASELPEAFIAVGTATVASVPVLFLIAVAVVVLVAYVMGQFRSGREMYAIGSDASAAVLYGLRTRRRVFFGFAASGALAGLAGVLYAARYATVSSGAGFGMELEAVAAAVLGGVAIVGGTGTVVGAALGAILLATVTRALPTLGIGEFWQQAVWGVLIIGAILLDRVMAARQARRLRSSRASVAETARKEPVP